MKLTNSQRNVVSSRLLAKKYDYNVRILCGTPRENQLFVTFYKHVYRNTVPGCCSMAARPASQIAPVVYCDST